MHPHADDMAMVGQEAWMGNPYAQCEPLFLQPLFEWGDHANAISENVFGSGVSAIVQKTRKRGTKIQPYCPGQMLTESANSHAYSGPSHAVTSENHDQDEESDCSTTDTANEAMTMPSIHTNLTDAPRLSDIDTAMFPTAGILSEMPWLDYSATSWELPSHTLDQASYWVPPMTAMQTQANQGLPSIGSAGHRKGCCKPCAFVYKGGCENGALCTYCHLCPPGEKQRRKRQVRFMQKNLGLGSPNLKA